MATDINKMSDKELEKSIRDKRAKLSDIRFGVAGSKNRDVREARNMRRDVARMLTEVTKRKNA